MNIEELNGLDVTILNYQTTYVYIQALNKNLRVNFTGKEEFKLAKETSGTSQLSENSPLLLDYNEPWSEIFINSKPLNPEHLMANIKTVIDTKTEGNRNWLSYVTKDCNFSFENFHRNIQEGNGLLMQAPISIANEIELLCNAVGVRTKSFTSRIEIIPKKILTIGANYVIAKEFII